MSKESASRTTWLRPVMILLFGLLVAGGLYLAKPEPEKKLIAPPKMMVDAIEVRRETVQLKVSTHGTVTASTETRLAAEVKGRVVAVANNFVTGGFFYQGERLVKIDDLEYRTAVKRAEANVAAAKTSLAEEQGRAEVAYQDWLRRNKQVQRSDAARDLALRKPQVAEAEASLEAAIADLARAEENLARTEVRAPYDGILRSRSVDLGQHVGTGEELGIIFSTEKMEVRLPVAEHKIATLDLPPVTYGSSPANGEAMNPARPLIAQLSVNINNETSYWQARITRTESVLDERSRVLYLIATIDDPYQMKADPAKRRAPLRLGTFVDADIYGKVAENVVRIPHHVLRTDNKVWIVDDAGSMHERPVEIISTDSEYTYLSAGVRDGERIAMGHLDNTVDGARVSIARLVELPPGESPAPTLLTEPGSNKNLDPAIKPGATTEKVAAKKNQDDTARDI